MSVLVVVLAVPAKIAFFNPNGSFPFKKASLSAVIKLYLVKQADVHYIIDLWCTQ
jgi:hypothetical protein